MKKPAETAPNMLGVYGGWIEDLTSSGPRPLSFLDSNWEHAGDWKKAAGGKVRQLLAIPAIPDRVNARVTDSWEEDGLSFEELSWQLPFGPETQAVFLKPAGASDSSGKLPGVLALHDHGGIKYFGKQKIVKTRRPGHPAMKKHMEEYYGGRAWANELARRGYGVLVHDVFSFGSRKILASDLPGITVRRMTADPLSVGELDGEDVRNSRTVADFDVPPDEPEAGIDAYNAFAAAHESIIAKSLFSAGLTWPGVTAAEDMAALGYLCSRPDIDRQRIGCCGLSGGGLRTNYLAGLDSRIKCSVTAGFMTTWRDLALWKCYTHTWMIYIPMLPNLMDFPDILGMHTPFPALVLATDEDPLFTLKEVEGAAEKLEAVYRKAGAGDAFRFSCYPGPHQFNVPMQQEAFEWFDSRLQ